MPLLGCTECPPGLCGAGEGKCIALPLPARHGKGMPLWGLGPSHTTHTYQEAEAKAPARLRATESGGGHTPFLFSFLPVLTCDQPCFKHVSTDPDSVLCGLIGWGGGGQGHRFVM